MQLGYEVYDKSYEINAVTLAISTAASRSNVIQSDDKTKNAIGGLNQIASLLRISPVVFFNELSLAASSRSNNEAWHIARIRNAFVNLDATLNVLLNSTGPLISLSDVTNPNVTEAIRASLAKVQLESSYVLMYAENITRDITAIRANSSMLLTPELIGNFIDSETTKQITSSLGSIRDHLAIILMAIRDVGRLAGAHGSVHELLSRSFSRDKTSRDSAHNNFVNNYNRVRNNLLSSVASYSQAAETGISNFITRVLLNFDDTIVRPKFEQVQLPLIKAFSDTIVAKVYNLTFFQASFDEMRDEIVVSFTNSTGSIISQGSELRDVILDLQRTLFTRRYSSCLNELVSEAQQSSSTVTGQYAFCLNERTSGIVVVIPSTSTWLSVIRDNINFILQQLNACLSGQTSVAGRIAISDCIQFVSALLSES